MWMRQDYAFLNKQLKCLPVCFSASEWRSGSESLFVKGVFFVLHRSLTHSTFERLELCCLMSTRHPVVFELAHAPNL